MEEGVSSDSYKSRDANNCNNLIYLQYITI